MATNATTWTDERRYMADPEITLDSVAKE